ncbi:3-isopropylmalate dehydratase small subunit [Candidatus Bipolaricaulota bacterium]|jgi:3-isopropylmalate/(R)-2-methylmalate dehydratase small subunit|nr:3-isopropylmalate dehydratase small subunit [Candidatus Bipolaricaulota bacterium]
MNQGRVWKYGDDVNTDVIFPGKYTYQPMEPAEMAEHALEDLDAGFAEAVQPGDIIVAGKNFGCGSSREQAATCLKAAGVAAIIAPSFSRIFFRNAINSGLPVIELAEGTDAIQTGDSVGIDFTAGVVEHDGRTYSFPPLPPEVLAILEDGGLIPHVKKVLNG